LAGQKLIVSEPSPLNTIKVTPTLEISLPSTDLSLVEVFSFFNSATLATGKLSEALVGVMLTPGL